MVSNVSNGLPIVQLLHCCSCTNERYKEIYYYKDGKYVLNGERLIEIKSAIIGPDVKTSVVNEVTQIINRTTPVDREEFDKDKMIINLKNGLLDLRTGIVRPHTPDYLSIIQLPVIYYRKAICKEIVHFLYNVLQEPRDVLLVLEFVAYCLFRDSSLQNTS